ncbi:AzlC family ABC transporter permease [Pseudoneobacillus sp. C159]
MAEMVMEGQDSHFKRGLQAGVSIAIGYFPIALTFGLLAKTTGLTIFETIIMSMIVFAGASQYISLSLLTLGTGIFEIILTTFIVNIRHLLMSASLNEKVEDDRTITKALYAFSITDETFSVVATKEGSVKTGYIFGVNSISYASWVVNSAIGFLVGASLPETLQESMTVALYAMFIGLLVPSMKKGLKAVYLAVLAAVFNSIFTFTEILSTGWSIVLATLLSAFLIEGIETIKNKRGGQAT